MNSACRDRAAERADLETAFWQGSALPWQREIRNPDTTAWREDGFGDAVGARPRRLLEIRPPGSAAIKLLEFTRDFEAYAAFQALAQTRELQDGFAVRGPLIFFHAGCWLGAAPFLPGMREELRNKLALPGSPEWGAPPVIFASMLHQGRWAGSERVLTRVFLGLTPPAPVFAAQLDCHGDSAWIYAAPDMPESFFELLRRSQGFRAEAGVPEKTILADSNATYPIQLVFFESRMVGVEGCFDTILTNRWIQTQKKALKSLKFVSRLGKSANFN